MKRKVFSLMMGLILAFTGLAKASELTVNDGTTTNALVPVYGLYADAYLKCEYILPASQLTAMVGEPISQMKFYLSSPAAAAWAGTNFKVFLKEVAIESLTAYNGYADATVVYQGALDGTQSTMVVNFTTPYTYNGGNLLVGFYNETIGTYKSASFYGVNAYDGDCIQGYSYSSLGAITVNNRNFLPKTTFKYGTPEAGEFTAIVDGEVVDTINVGARPSGAWMRPFQFTMAYEGEVPAAISVLDFTPNDGYFSMVDVEYPIEFENGDEVELAIATGETSEELVERQFVAIYDAIRLAKVWDITAQAYTPVEPDVWEMAREITDAYPFEYRNTATEGVTLYDNYLLPGDAEDGPDAVYKVTFNQDVMLNGTVTTVGTDEMAENAKMAVYTQAGIDEVGGPDLANFYVGPAIGGGAEPYDIVIGDETSTTTSSYQPYYPYFNNSLSQQLYQASLLQEAGMGAGVINTIGYYATVDFSNNNVGNLKIYMANVSDAVVPATSMPASAMTLVYEGSNEHPAMGWNDFALNGNFEWDGTSNLLVMFQRNNTSYFSGMQWQYTAQSYNAGAYVYSDATSFDPSTSTYALTTTVNLPNTHFVGGSRGNRDGDVLTYNFDDGTLQGWTTIDADGDGVNWLASSTHYSNSGSYAAVSQSYRQVLYPDNYLVSPQVTLGEGASISFYEASYYGYTEPIALMISTTGTNASDFTQLQRWDCYNTSFEQQTVDLSAYAGQQVYLAFRHYDSSDNWAICVDDITIDLGGTPGPVPPTPEIEYIIDGMTMVPGTYYIAA
ncbi:MAG: choice-of-anchor J domain-containing protein, partial [Bacteroidales bacterium]|nr:choice-of-anchor J domain-containing protein [Bacteroidales bacterium]